MHLIASISIFLPAYCALLIWKNKSISPKTQDWGTIIVLHLCAIIGLSMFITNQQYRCIFQIGRENCFIDGSASLSLLLLSSYLAIRLIFQEIKNKEVYLLNLTLISIWSGLALLKNVFFTLVFLNLLLFWIDRYLKMQGTSWRFLVLRDDYKDDYDDKN